MATGIISGSLPANQWTRVLQGWGYYSVDYGIRVNDPGGKYRCYTAPIPWPISEGSLPNPRVTHRVIGYGDVWLFCPVSTTYTLVPVFP